MSFQSQSAWGSVRVTARIGKSRWQTSLFPDSKAGAYLLPVKKSVREAENMRDGSRAAVSLELMG